MNKDGVSYYNENDFFPLRHYYFSNNRVPLTANNNEIYLPLQYADLSFPNESVLKAKFKIMGFDHMQWQDHFSFKRDRNKEDALYYNVLNLKDDTEYAFVNMWYGSPPGQVKNDTHIDTKLPKIDMSIIEGFSIFDWCKVIEKANELYCVDTSLFYIIEYLDLKANKLEAYSKFSPSNYMHIDGLFKQPWKYN